ncbi:MAG: hypothetical protein KGJ86_05585 [Chloroflexota bacterium]|nr:hypothetical protein [Chloroflexota bacterium]
MEHRVRTSKGIGRGGVRSRRVRPLGTGPEPALNTSLAGPGSGAAKKTIAQRVRDLVPFLTLAGVFLTLAGVIAAVISLEQGRASLDLTRQEQQRIAAEVSKRAEVFTGFPWPPPNSQILYCQWGEKPTWLPGQEKSEPVAIDLSSYNAGQKSAHNLLWNIWFFAPLDSPDIDGKEIRRATDGGVLVVKTLAELNPETLEHHQLRITFPRGDARYSIVTSLTMTDSATTFDFMYLTVGSEVPLQESMLQMNARSAGCQPGDQKAGNVSPGPWDKYTGWEDFRQSSSSPS